MIPLLPEASDLWLSPAEKLRQRGGWLGRVALLYHLRQQALLRLQQLHGVPLEQLELVRPMCDFIGGLRQPERHDLERGPTL